jgi:Zn-dependent protease with chaperone function/competence protein ComGC
MSTNPLHLSPTPVALTLPKEKTYGTIILIFSILVWAGLAISVVGAFYAALFALIGWLSHGLLAAHLRAESVRVSERQLPQLHATFVRICEKLGMTEIPRLYVLQAGGALNAFATKFGGRNFVVVNSDLLEAFGPESAEMEFILGHELGHLKSNHIFKRVLLAPGILLPLIGPAYLRACEASCDRHGAFVTSDLQGATRALLALSGGKAHGRLLDAESFAEQHNEERGFFISWHELSSPYPTLSQRAAKILAFTHPRFETQPGRHPLAYPLAMVTPGGRATSGGANALIFIVIIGLLAAMAIPAFQKVRMAAQEKACINNERMIAAAVQQYTLETGKSPTSLADFSGPGKTLPTFPACLAGGKYRIDPQSDGTVKISCSVHGTHTY